MTCNEAKDRVVEAARRLDRYVGHKFEGVTGLVITRRYLEAVRDALALYDSTPDSEGGWRPIDEAAKDGNYWLIGWFELPGQDSMAVAFWHSTHRAWCNTYTLFTSDDNQQPTHYRSRPAAPSQEQKP